MTQNQPITVLVLLSESLGIMHVGLKPLRGDREHCVTPARAAAKTTRCTASMVSIMLKLPPRRTQ